MRLSRLVLHSCLSCTLLHRAYSFALFDRFDHSQEARQVSKKVQEQGEQLRSAERGMKEVQMQLMTKAQADSTMQRDFAQLKVHSHCPF